MTVSALQYYGGKSPRRKLAHWIASRLPWEPASTYIEPFCGMCGVLLCREPVHTEIINDANDRLINWWNVVRDRGAEFGRLLEETHQHSRTQYAAACADLDCDDPMRRALAYTIVLNGSVIKADTCRSWAITYVPRGGGVHRVDAGAIAALRERTARTQIENTDAVALLERVRNVPEVVIYCDPPYRSAAYHHYGRAPDWQALGEVLRQQKGRVAVSGYGDEWDHLGWRVENCASRVTAYDPQTHGQVSSGRAERLWMNYPSEEGFGLT